MKQLFVLLLTCLTLYSGAQVSFTDSDLPIVVINTSGGIPIPDDPRVIAQMGVIDNGVGNRNYLTDPFNNYNGRIEIEIRGSTSQQYPKKNYGFETQYSDGSNLNVALLGLPLENDWILYGPYPDKTMIRNVLTYHLARNMGRYASHTRYCELVINGNYQGLYVLLERIKQDQNRVNIQDLHTPNTWDDTLTGGYIMKVDKLTGEVGYSWASAYNNEVMFQFHDPEYDELNSAQKAYMQDFISDFETTLIGSGFADQLTGYPYYMDAGSFHDFFILQELGRTVDGYRSSSFFYKDKDALNWHSKIYAGPMWDFNLSYGNADYCLANTTSGWQYNFDEVCDFSTSIPFWWKRLLDDPSYVNGLRCRWETLRQGVLKTENIHAFIDEQAALIEEARIRNFQKWPIIGVYVNWNGFVGQTYEEDLDYLKSYIEQRAAWMDANIPGDCNLSLPEGSFEAQYHLAWPNPSTDKIYIGFTVFESGPYFLEISNEYGALISRSDEQTLTQGKHTFVESIDKLSKGLYYYSVCNQEGKVYRGKIVKQ